MAERLLTEFDYGKVTEFSDGRTLREYEVVAIDKEIEIAKGIKFPGWTYNGTIPGPTFGSRKGIFYDFILLIREAIPILFIFMVFTHLKWME